MSHPTIAALRSLVDSRFPTPVRQPAGGVATGVPAIDDVLGGGLAAGRLTELVSAVAGSGAQMILTRLLVTTRVDRQRVALVDAADGFAPETVPDDALRHLVWVRPRKLTEALAAVDVLVRDGNYAVVVLDLRGIERRTLLGIPKGQWHRLHRAAESRPAAILVQTTVGVVPAVPWRLILNTPLGVTARRMPRDGLLAQLDVQLGRGHARPEELAG